MHSRAEEFMHLLIFLHTQVINLCAINWASKQGFPQLCIAPGKAGPKTRWERLQFSRAFLFAAVTGRFWIVMSRVFLILPGLFLEPLPIWPRTGVHWSFKAEWAENVVGSENVVLITIFKQIWHLHLTWGSGNENQTWNHLCGNAKPSHWAGKTADCRAHLERRHNSIKANITLVQELLFQRTVVHSFLSWWWWEFRHFLKAAK